MTTELNRKVRNEMLNERQEYNNLMTIVWRLNDHWMTTEWQLKHKIGQRKDSNAQSKTGIDFLWSVRFKNHAGRSQNSGNK